MQETNDMSVNRQRGFTLVELAIVLAVLGIMMGGLFQLTAATSRTIQDQVTAGQFQQYIRATRAYLGAHMTVDGSTGPATVSLSDGVPVAVAVNTATDITTRVRAFRQNYLPTQTPQLATFNVRLRRLPDIATAAGNEPLFAIAVIVTGGNTYGRPQIGTISTLIGAEGAGVLAGGTTNEGDVIGTDCDEGGVTVRSVFAAACIDAADFGAVTSERPAALVFATPSDLTGSLSQWLSRVNMPGAPQMTTMSTDLTMGAAGGGTNDIIMTNATNNIIMNGGTISNTGAGAVLVSDSLSITGGAANNLSLSGGQIRDSVNSYVTVGTNLRVASGSGIEINGSINGHTGGGVQGIQFYNSSGNIQFPLNVGGPTGVGDFSSITIGGAILPAVGVRVEGSLSARSFIYVSSDRALKYDIKPIPSALDKILKIDGVSYRLKANDRATMGVVAQDVEAVLPELVAKDVDGHKMVNYDGLTGVVIQAIHELAAENKALRQRIEKLERAAQH